MNNDSVFQEVLSSKKTSAVFYFLMIFFLMLLIWRVLTANFDVLAVVCLVFSLLFLFYILNFKTLRICLSPDCLQLKFGLFQWDVPIANIAECRLDEVPAIKRLGGAGIHFMCVGGRYRASFNFLEYDRIVIAFKNRVGPVRDLSFSSSQPIKLLALLQNIVNTHTQPL